MTLLFYGWPLWNICVANDHVCVPFDVITSLRIHISKKNKQHNVPKKKDKQRSTKHTNKTKDRVTRTPLKTGGELKCSGRVSSSCSTSDARHGCVPFVVNTSLSFPNSWLITGFVTRLTWRASLVEQELLTLPEHLSSPPVFSGVRVTRSLVLFVCFVDRMGSAMTRATFVIFFYRSFKVLLTDVVIIPRWAIQAPGSL
jgi:hypothetical protein